MSFAIKFWDTQTNNVRFLDFDAHLVPLRESMLYAEDGVPIYLGDRVKNRYAEGLVVFEEGSFKVKVDFIEEGVVLYRHTQGTPLLWSFLPCKIVGSVYNSKKEEADAKKV